MTIKDLKPQVVWNNFYGLTRCPRPSKHEEIVRQHLLDWAKEHKVEAFADETGNVIMRIPATPGYENRKGVVLQGHMDMVPQKTADTTAWASPWRCPSPRTRASSTAPSRSS